MKLAIYWNLYLPRHFYFTDYVKTNLVEMTSY